MRKLMLLAAATVLVVAPACGQEGEDAGAAVSQTVAVEAFDFYFEPTSLLVELGARVTVEFTNNGSVSHSFSAPDLDAEVEAGNGQDATVTFTVPDQPGSFDFFCKYHADQMTGTISIGGGDDPLEEDPDDTDDDDDEDVEVDVDEDDDAGAGSDDDY
ncbi:MAG: cupredoxin domain-containing protein [Actinomycetota bacterium]